MDVTHEVGHPARREMLSGIAVVDRQRDVDGVATAVLEGGDGPPVVLLHGPGEAAVGWLPVLPQLLRSHRVVVPDLPGHGATHTLDDEPYADRLLDWLDNLIDQTCSEPPALVGRTIGAAIGARYAIERPGRLARLVLVDALGLAPFEPLPRFALAMHRYFGQPDRVNYERFMEFCAYDLDGARTRLGVRWEPYATYAVELGRSASGQAAMGRLLAEFAAPIAPERLDRIDVPTSLIWGREDIAIPVRVGEAAAARHGWPLRIVDDAGDDPPLDQPAIFLDELRAMLDGSLVAAPGREA
jgi:pimeloyl-ACP methyl ester carboxylesterase